MRVLPFQREVVERMTPLELEIVERLDDFVQNHRGSPEMLTALSIRDDIYKKCREHYGEKSLSLK